MAAQRTLAYCFTTFVSYGHGSPCDGLDDGLNIDPSHDPLNFHLRRFSSKKSSLYVLRCIVKLRFKLLCLHYWCRP